DFTTQSAVIYTIPAGTTSVNIPVTILGDQIAEPTESFTGTIAISNGNGQQVTVGAGSGMEAGTATATITDEDAATITISDIAITETNSDATHNFVATMSKIAQADVSIFFTTTAGTAGSTDFTAQSAVIYTIPAGTTSVNIPVTILGDQIAEPTESFTGTIAISNGNGQQVTVGAGSETATATITDDDFAIIYIENIEIMETNTINPYNFIATISKVCQIDVVISFTTIGGSAGVSDFTQQSAVMYTIPAGATSVNIPVSIVGDQIAEPTESFTGAIDIINTNGQQVIIGSGTASATIADDDTATISIAAIAFTETNSDVAHNFVTTMSRMAQEDVQIFFTTSAGTAGISDFTAQSAVVYTIPAGSTSVSIPVVILGDEVEEPTESFTGSIAIGNTNRQQIDVDVIAASATATIMDDDFKETPLPPAPVDLPSDPIVPEITPEVVPDKVPVIILETPVNDPALPVYIPVAVPVTTPNNPPVASALPVTTLEDTQVNGMVTATDSDGDDLTFGKSSNPQHGQVTVSSNGTCNYMPEADYFGADSFKVNVSDGKGGEDTVTVNVTIAPVNDAPSFKNIGNQTACGNGTLQTTGNWATAITAGPANESGQKVQFKVTNSNNALFSIQPSVDPSGTLTYIPESGQSGTATVSVWVTDDGGTLNGGINASAAQTFTIRINDLPAAPEVNTMQEFCARATVADLIATAPAGSAVNWFESPTGGNPLESSFPLKDITLYYAESSNLATGCKSLVRAFTVVIIHDLPAAPTGALEQAFCEENSPKMSDLTLVGLNLKCYAAATGGTEIAKNTLLVSGTTYYASQTTYSCESAGRTAVSVDVSTCNATLSETKDFTVSTAKVDRFIEPQSLFIPEGFSPNGDGINDYFVITGAEKYVVTLRVFNRWGNKVFECEQYKNDWDGVSNVGMLIGNHLPGGTYYCTVSLNNGSNEKIGFITLKR
ncbi:MAG: gliding motility-associated C-terminal domain-containing protein, partial [Prolixibacteraceae bacterium]